MSCIEKPGNAKTVCECKKLYPQKGKEFGMCVSEGATKLNEERKLKLLDRTTETMQNIDVTTAKKKEKLQKKAAKKMQKMTKKAQKRRGGGGGRGGRGGY